jgi:ribosome-binding protein aMBF1 (putative translation factor)
MSQQVYCNVATQNVTIKLPSRKPVYMDTNKELWRAFGAWIRDARENKSLSQSGLGNIVGLDRQQIYRIENGLSGTKRETVARLADALDLDESEAYRRAGYASAEQH